MGCLFSHKMKPPVDLDPINVTLEHFEKLRVIGKGAFGKVHAVMRRDTRKLFAMKCLDKRQIVRQRMLKNVLNEREILSRIDYPLIVNLRFSLQTPTDLYMILDLMQGGDVRYHLKQEKKFSPERAKFYIAQTALSLHYMHQHNLVHRDIKPDNLLLDQEGHCHVTDFNLSVVLGESGVKGVAGTRPYMAPEILRKGFYDERVDWWSLGILWYELLYGRVPFSGHDNEALRRNILAKDPNFPKSIDEELLYLLKGLLNKNPDNRLGFDDLKKSKYFVDYDWNALEAKIAEAPWKPNPDRAHVDGSYDLDEQFEAKPKKQPLPPEQQKDFDRWDYNPLKKKAVPYGSEPPKKGADDETSISISEIDGSGKGEDSSTLSSTTSSAAAKPKKTPSKATANGSPKGERGDGESPAGGKRKKGGGKRSKRGRSSGEPNKRHSSHGHNEEKKGKRVSEPGQSKLTEGPSSTSLNGHRKQPKRKSTKQIRTRESSRQSLPKGKKSRSTSRIGSL